MRDLSRLLAQMTIEEKVGQLMLLSANFFGTEVELTGPAQEWGLSPEELSRVGGCLGGKDASTVRKIQEKHLASDRNKIPLMFMNDVIHGFRTIYPINLGLSCSFDPELVGECTRMSAKEAAAGGVHLSFAPMIDLARDARWGRVMESSGEDKILASALGAAQVKAYQGEDLTSSEHIAACVKHFAAYGAGESGRDYNTVDMSERTLREFYLPTYKACIDAGVKMLMTAFNSLNGLPATVNPLLMKQILREEWGYDGVVVSDWGAIYELTVHSVAGDLRDAARQAFDNGCHIDMCSKAYYQNLSRLVREGVIPESDLDDAVMKILTLKDELGLFENPYHGANAEKGAEMYLSPEHRAIARRAAAESAVLLKNNGTLPFSKDVRRVAIVGPLADDHGIIGVWASKGKKEESVTVAEGVRALLPDAEIVTARGCGNTHTDTDESGFAEAIELARGADAVIICVGEHAHYGGEANSRTSLDLPGVQAEFVKAITAVNGNSAVLLFNTRPLSLVNIYDASPAILDMFFPGTEGGNAAAELLFGEANPSGKLSMSFPKSVGQCPIYYNRMLSGRPKVSLPDEEYQAFSNGYIDCGSRPLFFFGEGLSYTSFEYKSMELDSHELDASGKIRVSVTVRNAGDRAGKEVVQLYIRDIVSSTIRPVQELYDFCKISLEAGEEKTVVFEITEPRLRFWDAQCRHISECGEFSLFVGYADHPIISDSFRLVEGK